MTPSSLGYPYDFASTSFSNIPPLYRHTVYVSIYNILNMLIFNIISLVNTYFLYLWFYGFTLLYPKKTNNYIYFLSFPLLSFCFFFFCIVALCNTVDKYTYIRVCVCVCIHAQYILFNILFICLYVFVCLLVDQQPPTAYCGAGTV